MRKRLAIVIAFAVVAAMVAAVATASPPVVLQKQAHSTRAFSGLPLCSGFTVSATFEVTRTLTDVTHTSREDGVLRHITVAGMGIVLHQSGRTVLSWNGTPPPNGDDGVVIFSGRTAPGRQRRLRRRLRGIDLRGARSAKRVAGARASL